MNVTMPLDPQLLDCRESTLALALRDLGLTDLVTLLGAQWWFDLSADGRQPVWDFEKPIDRIAELTGLACTTRPLTAGSVAEAARAGGVAVVVSDAYVMPWLPYAGRKHVEHSFVVGHDAGRLHFVDGYANSTEWGDATPGTGPLDPDTVAAICAPPDAHLLTLVPPPGWQPPAIGPEQRADLLRRNAARLAGWPGPEQYAAYAEHCCAAPADLSTFEAFCETAWSLERRRALNAKWLDRVAADGVVALPPDLGAQTAAVVARWADVNRFTYLALRRLRAGRAPSAQLAELVRSAAKAEAEVAGELAALRKVSP